MVKNKMSHFLRFTVYTKDRCIGVSMCAQKSGAYFNWVVTGATCSTVNGTQALLVVNEARQYECVCRGSIASIGSRICILHYWICPPPS